MHPLFLTRFLRVSLPHGCKYQFPLALFALNGLLRANISGWTFKNCTEGAFFRDAE
jgi:hypothetical protein